VSEEKGKAKDIIGEESKGELKTRFAAAIAAAITPTPTFDLAECEMPGSTNRRLCVIRVRPSNRIHYLTTKDAPAPVYVRNEDQAIPARAAELKKPHLARIGSGELVTFGRRRPQSHLSVAPDHETQEGRAWSANL
jgi:hypothetical protein